MSGESAPHCRGVARAQCLTSASGRARVRLAERTVGVGLSPEAVRTHTERERAVRAVLLPPNRREARLPYLRHLTFYEMFTKVAARVDVHLTCGLLVTTPPWGPPAHAHKRRGVPRRHCLGDALGKPAQDLGWARSICSHAAQGGATARAHARAPCNATHALGRAHSPPPVHTIGNLATLRRACLGKSSTSYHPSCLRSSLLSSVWKQRARGHHVQEAETTKKR